MSLVGLDTNECIWIFNEPAGSRVRIKIIEYSVSLFTLQIGSGVDPSYGEPIAVITDHRLLPLEVSADAPSVWMTLTKLSTSSRLKRIRIAVTVYNITGKEQNVLNGRMFNPC